MPKEYVVLGVVAVIVAGIALFQFLPAPKEESVVVPPEIPEGAYSIVLTKDGFVPETITIKKGETIAFSTDAGNLFWPASNLHPSHLIYSEFDPKEPVQPTDVWSFTFNEVGEWEFHDHLAPYFTGVITVTE